MSKYTIWVDMMGDNNEDDFQPRFTFEVEDQKEANQKAREWARYQGFTTQEVAAKVTEGEQLNWPTHNEFL